MNAPMTTLHFSARAYSELPTDLRLVVQVYPVALYVWSDGAWRFVRLFRPARAYDDDCGPDIKAGYAGEA